MLSVVGDDRRPGAGSTTKTATTSDAASLVDPRQLILAGPMSRHQVVAVAMTVALCILDGIDVMAMTFAAPAIAAEWHVGKAALGYVLSAGLLGMAGGSLLIAPLADIVGRRRLIYASLVMMVAGTLWTANVHGLGMLLFSRIVTGLGIGTMISVVNPLAAEYANARRRDLSVSITNIGLSVGAVLGGFLATILLPTLGWRSIFVSASMLGAAMIPAVWLWLPEPISIIIARPSGDSLAKVNLYLKRCGLRPVTTLPPPPADAATSPILNLFRGGTARVTLTLAGIYFFYIMTMFYMQTWIPTLVTSVGFAPREGAMISVFTNVGGIIGGLVLGLATLRFGLKAMVLGAFVIAALLTVAFGRLPPSFGLIAVTAFVTGFFLIGAGAMGLYAIIGRSFPAHMRASGVGLTVGVGRIGSAIAPAAGGLLFASGLDRGGVALAMAIPALLAAILLMTLKVRAPTTA
jgi:AAHS family 4-hydroxybenzoate transporter-like MFS transporter